MNEKGKFNFQRLEQLGRLGFRKKSRIAAAMDVKADTLHGWLQDPDFYERFYETLERGLSQSEEALLLKAWEKAGEGDLKAIALLLKRIGGDEPQPPTQTLTISLTSPTDLTQAAHELAASAPQRIEERRGLLAAATETDPDP